MNQTKTEHFDRDLGQQARAVADEIDKRLHEKFRAMRETGELATPDYYRVSAAIIEVTKDYRS